MKEGGGSGSSNWPVNFRQARVPVRTLPCDSDLIGGAPESPTPRIRTSTNTMGGGAKIPYPKHVWSPAGGWYAQPNNWKANTAVVGLTIVSIAGMAWMLSANREYRDKMPEKHRFFPSRHWTKQIKEHERKQNQSIVERVLDN
ncbi:hypothetical protein GMOD_00000128 [Pyrenophora seminiperda CCB06]|uniref:Uncharacterized protein n=1 Tax=Pyrenophora seminiperda CCB06 TaxID=1302712 RepID=A0A3M7M6F9_9PLEO|nr:hypothetical protein GMOD_00000128 [Pyrenophora seminiperda CCB06]